MHRQLSSAPIIITSRLHVTVRNVLLLPQSPSPGILSMGHRFERQSIARPRRDILRWENKDELIDRVFSLSFLKHMHWDRFSRNIGRTLGVDSLLRQIDLFFMPQLFASFLPALSLRNRRAITQSRGMGYMRTCPGRWGGEEGTSWW